MILVGSTYFFNCYPDFISKDKDYVEVVRPPQQFKHICQIHLPDRCIFRIVKTSKQELIDFTLQIGPPMAVGKFLVPRFCEIFGITLSDLEQLEPLFEQLDDKHKYEKIIYESYKANGGFFLTYEQRSAAYAQYKYYR